ncbi:type II toxin-antitoxin system Phd/YefM family antitoxin [Candidatus Nomurabacteria bacterium]|nr:type II toxin-antitoxin system Phd/YefM family antitoxin [Candidatus Nomurabacteria bacterium]
MNTKTTISITDARKRIFDIADEVQLPNRIYTLTADGKPKMVMMSAEEYESLLETISVLEEFPDIKKDIAEADEAFRTGEYKKWSTLDDLKREWGMSVKVAEKPKRKYGVHTSIKTKSKKRTH